MEKKEKDYFKAKVNKAVATAHIGYNLLKDGGNDVDDSVRIFSVWIIYNPGSKRHPEGKEIKCGEVRLDMDKEVFINYCFEGDKTLSARFDNVDEIIKFLQGVIDVVREKGDGDSDMVVRFLGDDTEIPVCHNKEE